MPRPVSKRRLAANRQNARKSTGPKTPTGKARSARNSIKHGLLSADVVVATGDGAERPQDFHALLDRLVQQFDPRDAIEHALVERVAACFWRLRRAQRFEVGALHEALDQSRRHPDDDQLAKLQGALHHTHNLRRHHAEDLQFLQGLDLNDPDAVKNARPMLDKIRLRFSGDVWDFPIPQMCELLLRKLPEYIRDFDDHEIPAIETRIEEAREDAKLRRERRALTAALPPPQEVLKLVRYESMLDRQLHRALARLDRRRSSRVGTRTRHLPSPKNEKKVAKRTQKTPLALSKTPIVPQKRTQTNPKRTQ